MARKINYTALGAFVVGAVALLLVAVAAFGSGELFKKSTKYITYFDSSIDGLTLGAPVKFRGARIGSVVDLRVEYEDKAKKILIPITIELEPGRIKGLEDSHKRSDQERQENLLAFGLRSQLAYESFVTGQRAIALDFLPDTPGKLIGAGDGIPEIPSIISPLEEISNRIERLPIDQIAGNLDDALIGINKLVNSEDLPKTITLLSETLSEIKTLSSSLNNEIGPVSSDARRLLNQDLPSVAHHAIQLLERLQRMFSENGSLDQNMGAALREIAAAARELREFVDYMKRHPEAFIKGKK